MIKYTKYKRAQDLSNCIFGELTVLSRNIDKCDGHVWWNCKCSCGSEIIVRNSQLIDDIKTKCNDCLYKRDKSELIGQKFNKLEVISKC